MNKATSWIADIQHCLIVCRSHRTSCRLRGVVPLLYVLSNNKHSIVCKGTQTTTPHTKYLHSHAQAIFWVGVEVKESDLIDWVDWPFINLQLETKSIHMQHINIGRRSLFVDFWAALHYYSNQILITKSTGISNSTQMWTVIICSWKTVY